MLLDMTGEALCKVLYARMEFQNKNYTKALVIRFFTEKWNVGTSFRVTVCHHYTADGNFQKDCFMF